MADRTQRDKLGYCVYYRAGYRWQVEHSETNYCVDHRAGYRWQVEHSETNKLLCRLQGRLETDDKETR